MKRNIVHTLLALCLPICGALSLMPADEASRPAPSKVFERAAIQAGLNRIGLGDGYVIIVAEKRDLVENTAAQMLLQFLAKASLSVPIVPESQAPKSKRIFLGRDSNLGAIRSLGDKGVINIRNVPTEDDGFHLKRIGQDIAIAGANPRGVLYGVYALEDFVQAGANGNLDIKTVPYFRKRGSGPCYTDIFFDKGLMEDFSEAKAVYLSRLGINELTDQGIGGTLSDFVHSDAFPFQKPPRPEFARRVKAMSALCKKYGIDQYIFLNEPALANIAADLEKYPPEALGTVKRPWGGGPDGIDKTLCVSSPIVQAYFRDMMRKLVREYPDLKGVQLYNMDASAWLCTPALCDRCRAVCTDSPPNEFTPWETQAKLVTLLAAAAHEENPGFHFRFWGAIHYHGRQFDKMIHAAQGYDSLLSSWNGSDRTVMIPDAAELDPAFILSEEVCRQRAIPFYAACEFNSLEVIPKSLTFPFQVADALKKYKRWGVKNIAEIYGVQPEHNSINALVTEEFEWNPDQNPEEFLTGLARRQFGEKAGKTMYLAWEEMSRAFLVWNDMQSGPLPIEGSQFHVRLGTSIGGLPPPILPDIVKYYDSTIAILTNVEPWRAGGYQKYKENAFLEKMTMLNDHLVRAAKQARQAVAEASENELIGVNYYEGGNGRPTCKEYAELTYAPIAIAEAICRQRCDMLRAYHLLTEIDGARVAGDEKAAKAKERLYLDLIREDIGVQERFCELLTGFAEMRPCFTRTSLSDREIADHLSNTKTKIDKLKDFLATH